MFYHTPTTAFIARRGGGAIIHYTREAKRFCDMKVWSTEFKAYGRGSILLIKGSNMIIYALTSAGARGRCRDPSLKGVGFNLFRGARTEKHV